MFAAASARRYRVAVRRVDVTNQFVYSIDHVRPGAQSPQNGTFSGARRFRVRDAHHPE